MSLISTKNLVAPVTNVVHLITILLIAIAFAVFRLSGASISMQSSNSAPVNRVQQQAPANVGTQLQRHERAPAPWQKQEKAAPRAPSQAGGGLDDIEKQLGL